MTQQLSAEALKQAGIAFLRAGEALTALANAMIVVGGEAPPALNPQGGVADPPKVAAEKQARGRRAAGDAPPPPAAAVPAAPAPATAALDYERDVKPLVVQMFEMQTKTIGKAEAVEFGKVLLQRYGADTFAPNGKPNSKPLAANQYPAVVAEVKRILAGEDTGVLHGTSDNDLGL